MSEQLHPGLHFILTLRQHKTLISQLHSELQRATATKMLTAHPANKDMRMRRSTDTDPFKV